MKITSAYANKLLKVWRTKILLGGPGSVIPHLRCRCRRGTGHPKYDYSAVSETLKEIDRKAVIIKHALNLANATAKIMVGDTEMSVDSILVRMAQLSSRKATLDTMRKYLPKMRESSHAFSSRNAVPEYRYTNYDPELVKRDYECISGKIMEMQIALDRYNQTFLFEADI